MEGSRHGLTAPGRRRALSPGRNTPSSPPAPPDRTAAPREGLGAASAAAIVSALVVAACIPYFVRDRHCPVPYCAPPDWPDGIRTPKPTTPPPRLIYIPVCTPNPCFNGGDCRRVNAREHTCKCIGRYEGSRCQYAHAAWEQQATWQQRGVAPFPHNRTDVHAFVADAAARLLLVGHDVFYGRSSGGRIVHEIAGAFILEQLRSLGVRSMIDVGCGDARWMVERVLLPLREEKERAGAAEPLKYIGVDIADPAIDGNRRRFGAMLDGQLVSLSFIKADAVRRLPQVTEEPILAVARDILAGMPHNDALAILCRVQESGAAFLIATTFMHGTNTRDPRLHRPSRYDAPDVALAQAIENMNATFEPKYGGFYFVNVMAPPFNFSSAPLALRQDSPHDDDDSFIGLWKLPVVEGCATWLRTM